MAKQVGGDHYQGMSIQPWEYTIRRFPGHAEATIIEYVTRWREKNGFEDLRKAISWIEKLIEVETELQAGVARLPDTKPEPAPAPVSVMRCDECGGCGYLYYRADRKLVCDKCVGHKGMAFTGVPGVKAV